MQELTQVARDAAQLVMTGFRKPGGPAIEFKGEIDLVTEFDRASEALIRERIARALPEFDLVAEEQGGSARGDRPVIYADPLDGTTNYAHGHPFFAVSLGLVSGTTLEAGVVVAPALGWTHAAARSHGATRNGEPCRVSSTTVLNRALLATGFPYDRRTSRENNFRAFIEFKKRAQGVRRCGAAALDLCMVADGTYDGYWERKLSPWDLAAGAAIVIEAGGKVTGFGGETVDVRAGSLIASNALIHEELIFTLAEAEAEPGL